ncbi:MAG TPA: hypothetical protein VGC36_08885 [Rhizomicrobium sp.]
MAQKAQAIVLVMALALPLAAEAGERRAPQGRAPMVLNGQLRTGDFTGGVGYASGGTYYVQGFSYGFANSGSSAFAATRGFIAGARASAFASANGGHR